MGILSRFKRTKGKPTRTGTVLDEHFDYTAGIQQSSGDWRRNPKTKAKTIRLCEQQIEISKSALKAWKEGDPEVNRMRKELGMKPQKTDTRSPRHFGFQTLAMIREYDKDYQSAIQLCQTAKNHGWSGDWDKRISRCRAKASKMKGESE